MRINYIHILIASIGGLAAVFAWYLPAVFGNRWTKLIKEYGHLKDEDLVQNKGRTFILGIIICYMNALVLNVVLKVSFVFLKINVVNAMMVSVLIWIGYGLTFSVWPVIFARQKPALWLLSNGAFLLMQLTMASILVLLY
ncbi:MAG: DUF1761 domain-containing protein [Bacteroidetes bacterium]|nr:DUF1761 domain-containing protein [Bacteroidota bacterium]